MAVKYRVCVIESEAGWGQRHEYEYFDTAEDAIMYRDYINKYNKPLKPGEIVPEWYMIAEKDIQVVEQ